MMQFFINALFSFFFITYIVAHEAPIKIKVGRVSSTHLIVCWERPENASFLQNYTVVYNSIWEVTVRLNESCHSVGSLSICTRYTFSVCANYPEGKRQCVNASEISLGAVLGPVSNLSVVSRSVSSVTIAWGEPSASDGKVLYWVFYKEKDEPDFVFYLQTDDSNVTLVYLKEFTEYEFFVQPFTVACGNGSSSSISVKTSFGEPRGGPLNVRITGVSSSELNVCWKAPESFYSLESYAVVFNYSFNVTVSRNESCYLARSLNIYTNYSFWVCANYPRFQSFCTNALGVTLEHVPNEPENFICQTFSESSIKLKWTQPVFKNGVLLAYKLHRNNVTILNNLALEFEDKSLVPFTSYVYVLSASTKVGFGRSKNVTCMTNKAASKGLISKSNGVVAGSIIGVLILLIAGPTIYYLKFLKSAKIDPMALPSNDKGNLNKGYNPGDLNLETIVSTETTKNPY